MEQRALLDAYVMALAMVALYRKIQDIARLMLVLWIGMLITAAWVIFTGMTHLDPKIFRREHGMSGCRSCSGWGMEPCW
jgi:putative effector of murein hydrolase